ncbi:MAG: peptidoglycan DD-metalloendopeptidase family protein [Bacteroidota bacterium]
MKKGPFKFSVNKRSYAIIGGLICLIGTLFIPSSNEVTVLKSSFLNLGPAETQVQLGDFPVAIPTYKYGFVQEAFQVTESLVQQNETIGALLTRAGVNYPTIQKLVEKSKGIFNVSSEFRVKKPYAIFSNKESCQPLHFVFQPNVYEYVVFDLHQGNEVKRVEKPIEIEETHVEGEIQSSLWETLTSQGISFEAAAKMEDALQWSVDFSHTQKGDRFKMVYDKKFIDGEEVGVGQVYAAYYNREGKPSFAIWFNQGEYKGFYDLEGRAIESNFLKAPVKYTRISSRYNKRRFHPILKRVRPHLGTDYAAPYGTPIYAVGNGVVTEKGYTKGNGRYIKIRHDEVYQTQYLHMSKYARNIKRGSQVAQGEVIGYVGSSGLATGPHVCFRFWKNGKQVNHLRENLPAPKPLPENVLPAFFEVRNQMLEKLGESQVETMETDIDSDP